MNVNITLLGVSDSGKTNFISEAVKDINFFAPKIMIMPVVSSQTAETEHLQRNEYVLKACENVQWRFSICDYDGIFTEQSSPMILLSETSNTKAAGLALLSIFYIRYAEEISAAITWLEEQNEEISKSRVELIRQAAQLENQKILGKLPANRRKLEDYNRQIESLGKEVADNHNRIRQYRNDMGLKHLSACVQCLVNYHKQLTINGFDGICYQEDASLPKTPEKRTLATVTTGFNRCMLGIFPLRLIGTVGFKNIFSRIVILAVIFVLTCVIESTVVRAVLGLYSVSALIQLFALSGSSGLLSMIGYIVWFIVSVKTASVLDRWRNQRTGLKGQSELAYFFNTRAKEKK